MGKYFSIEELSASSTAKEKSINNEPNSEIIENLSKLIEVLDVIRESWGAPIHVNSGYRSRELNTVLKGAVNSQHMSGLAADITTRNKTNNRKLYSLIIDLSKRNLIKFDQLIDESGFTWIHISVDKDGNNREQVFSL